MPCTISDTYVPSLENAFNKHPWPHTAVARSNVIDNVRRGGGIGSVTGRPLGHCAQRAQWPRERVLRRVVIDRPCMSLLGGALPGGAAGLVWFCKVRKCLPSVASEYQVRVKFRSLIKPQFLFQWSLGYITALKFMWIKRNLLRNSFVPEVPWVNEASGGSRHSVCDGIDFFCFHFSPCLKHNYNSILIYRLDTD